MEATEEQFRRMAFNILARNQDDHVKNIAFLMDKAGRWSLAPAFDVTYSYNPAGDWTARHQMTMNGKRDGFTVEDFRECARNAVMKRGRAETILEEVGSAVRRWPEFAAQAGVADTWSEQIGRSLRMDLAAVGAPQVTGGENAAGETTPQEVAAAEKRAADFVVVAHELN
jgi:serine/threonine-protein kinase HipA